MSNVLLVGAEGYIGSNCPFECDKVDLKTGQNFLEMTPRPYSAIIFLAAKLGNTWADYLYNEGLYAALDRWLALYPNTQVIYASSAAVYGDSRQLRREYDFPRPINLYGESKLSGEYHVREYDFHCVLRFGNVYGQMNGQPGHGVTEIFENGGITIFGDGTQVRDFVPVSKVWQVIGAACFNQPTWQGVFNVSLKKPYSINDWFFQHRSAATDPIYEPAPLDGEIKVSRLDNIKMVAALGRGERDRE